MNIYYQWEPWAYMHQASIKVEKNLDKKIDKIIWLKSFEQCWEKLDNHILVLAIENSYAGTIYENLYKFITREAKIIWEYNLSINHCICSNEKDLKDITKVYSHFKALPQCYTYFKKNNITDQRIHSDTAWAAKMLSKSKEKNAWAICSVLAAEMYWLNVLEKNIQDQKGNTTKFLVIISNKSDIKYNINYNQISILFEAKNIPSSLHKCLWVFSENNINLIKIESTPNFKNPFSYLFFITIEGNLEDIKVKKSLTELETFTNKIKILWEY